MFYFGDWGGNKSKSSLEDGVEFKLSTNYNNFKEKKKFQS